MDPLDFNFAHALALFASTSKVGEVLETQDFVLVDNRAPLPEFNQVYLKRADAKVGRALDRLLAHYARQRLPFCLHARRGDPALMSELLLRGFVPRADLPCMELDPDAKLPRLTPTLRVRSVSEGRTLADFQRVAFESWGYPIGAAGQALTESLIAMPHAAFFVGYLDHRPVCCSGLIVTGDVAGIYWVGTLSAQRKLGLGAAITAHAAEEARLRGLSRVCLQASELGAPVCRRIGFREKHSYLRFTHS